MPSPLAPRTPSTLAQPSERPGFFAGFAALFRGLALVAGTPALWPLALTPVAIATTLGVGLALLATHFVPPLVIGLVTVRLGLTGRERDIAIPLIEAVAIACSLVAATLAAFGLAQPLASPALSRIARRVGRLGGARGWPEEGALVEAGRSILSVLVGFAFALPLLVPLFILSSLFPWAMPVLVPLKVAVLSIALAWDLCDPALSIRAMPVARRVALVVRNLRAMLGFGLGLALLSFVPCGLFVALPVGVAGAALLVRAIELSEGTTPPR